jgi:hypothetical protein
MHIPNMDLLQILLLAAMVATSSTHPITGSHSPVQTPMPLPAARVQHTSATAIPIASAEPGCTSTLDLTHSRLPSSPHYSGICPSHETETRYASTRTLEYEIDCHGCAALDIKTHLPQISCPQQTPRATTSLPATTVYRTICAPSPSSPAGGDGDGDGDDGDTARLELRDGLAVGAEEGPVATQLLKGGAGLQACSTTLIVPGMGTTGTTTQYQRVVTLTSRLNCGGCGLVLSTRIGGLGPIMRPGVTATEAVGTSTVYTCTG